MWKRLMFMVLFCVAGAGYAPCDDMLASNVGDLDGTSATAGYYEVRGYDFRTKASSYGVNYLGLYDHFSNGFAKAHDIGIWTTAGSFITSATVSAGTRSPFYKGFRWVKLSETIVLPANSTYVLAVNDMPWNEGGIRDNKYVDFLEIESSDALEVLPTLRLILSTTPLALTFPTSLTSNREEVGFGANLAGSIEVFDEYQDTNTSVVVEGVRMDVEKGFELSVPNPDPFATYSLLYTPSLQSVAWSNVGTFAWNENQTGRSWCQVTNLHHAGFFRVLKSVVQ